MGLIEAAFFEDDEVRAALAARSTGRLYRLLRRVGMSQCQIAHLTGQSQSEVGEILHSRQVCNVWLLERIADRLGLLRARMGLSYGEDAPPAEKVDEEMRRRVLIAATIAAAMSQGAQSLGELIQLAWPAGQALPSRLDMSHAHTVRAVTERLRGVARYHGGQGDLFGAAATLYTRGMQVPSTEVVKARLAAALAELHTEAGWSCYDSGVDGRGHFTRALRRATEAGDAYGVANAAWNAGATLVLSGNLNDALKLFQLGQFCLPRPRPGRSTPATPHADDPRIATLTAKLARQSATAYAVMKGHDEATRCLARRGHVLKTR
ncbi:MAG: helix-turn-helix transcriptional regulator, partial [Pseudonocardiales bacterium]|nr:helix-turn-helix transcriptional regulator [Pseudonocardiales bacterium]